MPDPTTDYDPTADYAAIADEFIAEHGTDALIEEMRAKVQDGGRTILGTTNTHVVLRHIDALADRVASLTAERDEAREERDVSRWSLLARAVRAETALRELEAKAEWANTVVDAARHLANVTGTSRSSKVARDAWQRLQAALADAESSSGRTPGSGLGDGGLIPSSAAAASSASEAETERGETGNVAENEATAGRAQKAAGSPLPNAPVELVPRSVSASLNLHGDGEIIISPASGLSASGETE